MICFVLLLTASILITNAIPIERNSLRYYEDPKEVKDNYNNYKKHNYFNLPKSSYGFRPQMQPYSSKRNKSKPPTNIDEIIGVSSSYESPFRSPDMSTTEGPDLNNKPHKDPMDIDDIINGKRSSKSQELYEKLIALGLDYIEATNIIEALNQYKLKNDEKNIYFN